jgi:hypothetical protein
MRRALVVASAMMVLFTTGCGSAASTNLNDYVGEYVFKPSNAAPGDFANFVILRKNQTAVEIRFSPQTGDISTTQEKWYLSHTTGENVVIGKFSHPIERSGSTVKLGINDDLGQYYEKVR